MKVFAFTLVIMFSFSAKAQFGTINTVAGNGSPIYGGDGGPAISAGISFPMGIWVDPIGNIYIADYGNSRIRKVTASSGIITTIAGNGTYGYSGDGGAATAAQLTGPGGIFVDPSGNIYVADLAGNNVRKINAAGIISTVAGTGFPAFAGDGGPATSANLHQPYGVWVDASNNLYITDQLNYRVRKVDGATGIISTIAGNGGTSFCCDGGPATNASFSTPAGIVIDASGVIYFSTQGGDARVRKIDLAGNIHTEIATGVFGFSGDCGPATAAVILWPQGLALEAAGNLYMASSQNNRVRRVTSSTGLIHTIAGSGSTTYSGDGGPATDAGMTPFGVFVDGSNNIYIAGDEKVRKITLDRHRDTVYICNSAPTLLVDSSTHADSIRWNTGATGGEITVTSAGLYWAKKYVCTFFSIDTFVVLNTNPGVSLGRDTTVCGGASFSLSSSIPYPVSATFLWNSGSTSPSVIVTSSGSYSLSVTVNSCTMSDTIVTLFPIVSPPTLSGINSYCQYQAYIPPAVLGTSPLWYTSPTGGVGSPITPVVNTSILGTYNFYISQSDSGCESGRSPFVVNVYPYPVVHLGNDTTICTGGTLTLSSSISYPAGTSFIWNTGSTSPTITTGSSGTFWLSVTNNNCTTIDTMVTNIHNILMPTISGTSVYCQYQPYTPHIVSGTNVLWYDAPIGGVGSPIAPFINTSIPGTYTLFVSQSDSGCESGRAVFVVTVNPKPSPPLITDVPNTYCGGTPFTPFSVVPTSGILWYASAAGGPGSPTAPTINTTLPGTYTVFATQTQAGCESDMASCTVTVFDSLVAGFNFNVTLGCSSDTVALTNNSIGAGSYSWQFGNGQSGTAPNTTEIYTAQGIYNVKLVVSNANCTDSVTHTINLVHPLQAHFGIDTSILCQGHSIGFTDASIGSFVSHFWTFGDGTTSVLANPTHTFLNAGVYHVFEVVSNAIPCFDTVFAILEVDSNKAASKLLSDTVICLGTHITVAFPFTKMGLIEETWSMGDGRLVQNTGEFEYAYNEPGTYLISATANYKKCPAVSDSKIISVVPQASIYLGRDTGICKGGETIILTDERNKGNTAAAWIWNTGATTPSITVIEPGIYTATVSINGCIAASSITINNDCYLDIPNAFTPNGDNVNDYFLPRELLSRGLQTFGMKVFNRWGQLVFGTNTIDGRGWDGTFNDSPQPEGVYVYIIDCTFKDGQKNTFSGNVTLLR